MSIMFCIVRRRDTRDFLCKWTNAYSYSEYTYGTETDVEWEPIPLNDTRSSRALVIFESKEKAEEYMEHNWKPLLEIIDYISLSELDAIAEAYLLGDKSEGADASSQ